MADRAEEVGLAPTGEAEREDVGNLYDIPVYVAERLAQDEEIVFNACSHTLLMRLAYADYERLVKPKVASFAVGPPVAAGS